MSEEKKSGVFPTADYVNSIIYHLDCIEMVTKDTPPEWFDEVHALWMKDKAKTRTPVEVGFENPRKAADLVEAIIENLSVKPSAETKRLAEDVAQGIIGA